jgi:hypothetical protein
VSWQELNSKQMDPVQAAGRRAQEAQMVALRRPSLDWSAPLAPALVEAEVDLTPYVNTSAFKVQDALSLERAYILFRSMGLRHLVVVDEHNRVQGIVTRKDLMGFRLDEALGRALRRVASAGALGQQNWIDGCGGGGGGVGGGGAGGGGGGGGGAAAAGGERRSTWQQQAPPAGQLHAPPARQLPQQPRQAGAGPATPPVQQQQQQQPDSGQQQQSSTNSEGLPVSINPIW